MIAPGGTAATLMIATAAGAIKRGRTLLLSPMYGDVR
jgi:hypothetical protein